MDKLLRLLLSLSFVFLISGCAGQRPVPSGFLTDVPEESFFAQHPSKNLGEYSKFIIDPVKIHWHPSADVSKVKPEELKELTDYFYTELITALEDGYSVMTEPGAGVLRIRIAITDVKANQPLLNVHWITSLPGMGLGGASMEAEFVDSRTGERIAAFMDSRKGKRYKKLKGLTKWGHTQDIFKQWARLIKNKMDELHKE